MMNPRSCLFVGVLTTLLLTGSFGGCFICPDCPPLPDPNEICDPNDYLPDPNDAPPPMSTHEHIFKVGVLK